MSNNLYSTDQPIFERLISLLKFCKFKILDTNFSEIGFVKVEYFSPSGRLVGYCIFLNSEQLKNKNSLSKFYDFSKKEEVKEGDIFLFTENENIEHLKKEIQQTIKIKSIENLTSELFQNSGINKTYGYEFNTRLEDNQELLPVTCDVESSAGIFRENINARFALEEFVKAKHESLCGIVGSFGTGKSTLIYNFVSSCSLSNFWSENSLIPIIVDLGGVGGAGIESAINNRVNELFGVHNTNGLVELIKAIGENQRVILFLDSLDEQIELSPKIIFTMITKLRKFLVYDVKIVLSFRPELFESKIDYESLFEREFNEKKFSFRIINLKSLDKKSVQNRIEEYLEHNNVTLPAPLKSFALRISEKPLWLKYILNFSNNTAFNLKIPALIEHCISQWSARELRTSRPVLFRHERENLIKLITFCMITGKAIKVEKVGKIHRTELVRFVHSIFPKLDEVSPQATRLIKWNRFSPDLAAESLAVANLLTIDNQGYLGFSEEEFYFYFLAGGIVDILDNYSHSYFDNPIILDLFNIEKGTDIIGSTPLPESEIFFNFISDYFEIHTKRSLKSNVDFLFNLMRPKKEDNKLKDWKDYLIRFDNSELEEAHSYEVRPPYSWPCYTNYFMVLNGMSILSSIDNLGHITSIDFSFLDITEIDLSGMVFEDCNFQGANLAYSDLSNTTFVRCKMDFVLLFKNLWDGTTQFNDCKTDLIINLNEENVGQFLSNFNRDLLDEMIENDEEWVICSEPISIAENRFEKVQVMPFVVSKAPVTNGDFVDFLLKNPSFQPKDHGAGIENKYYLPFFDRLCNDQEISDLPVVYISLISAIAYADSLGKRLPNAAEFHAYESIVGKDNNENSYGDQWSIPKVMYGENYPTGIVTEWTYQVDNVNYWESPFTLSLKRKYKRICPLPPFIEGEKIRCEYIIAGGSYLPRIIPGKISKQATWINPDQGFRCVMNYSIVANRYVENQND